MFGLITNQEIARSQIKDLTGSATRNKPALFPNDFSILQPLTDYPLTLPLL